MELNRLETWCNIVVILAYIAMFVALLVKYIKYHKQLKAECEADGTDWREYDEELINLRNFLRTFGLKFLIRKKYRNLDE
jgi:hypothetical protein